MASGDRRGQTEGLTIERDGSVDLTIVAIPAYLGGMGAEYLWLKRTAAERGLATGGYERQDTIASLSMGVGSLIAPIVMGKVLAPVTPGKGRFAKALVVTAIGAGIAATVADVMASRARGPLPEAGVVPEPASPIEQEALAPRVASTAAAAALIAGGLSVATGWARLTAGRRLFAKRLGPDLGDGPLAVAGAILAWDFVYYWNHRLAHESRYLWAMHVVHHSSEHYNLSTALRQPVTESVTCSIPYGILALAGFRPDVIETARGVNLLYQFWIHTEAIDSIGPAEKVLNSPSLHRVHHGSNQKYLDRNHGSILIIWDRLFGTHQVEEEPVTYGLTTNIDTFNPARIATHEWRDMVGDVRRATSWRERVSYVFRGPGWAYARRAETASAVASSPVEVVEPVAAGVA